MKRCYRRYEEWRHDALAEGYPICPDCQDPLPKRDWSKGRHGKCIMVANMPSLRLLRDRWHEREKIQGSGDLS